LNQLAGKAAQPLKSAAQALADAARRKILGTKSAASLQVSNGWPAKPPSLLISTSQATP
jgi:hypothetical protein